jgi:excisionase family DNA binding protein
MTTPNINGPSITKAKPVKKRATKAPSTDVLTVEEAAARLGISRNSAYLAAASGQIPTLRIGRLLRVPVRALERLLEGAGCEREA